MNLASIGSVLFAVAAVNNAAASARVLWVDGSASEGGDGTSGRPLRSLKDAVVRAGEGAVIHVRTGVYPGPLALTRVRLVGEGRVMITAEPTEIALVLKDATVDRVHVQGGVVGASLKGATALHAVGFSGQRQAGARVEPGAWGVVQGCRFMAAISETEGVRVEGQGRLLVAKTSFTGPYRRAVRVLPTGTAELVDLDAEGPVTVLHAVDADVRIREGMFQGGRGPAIFVAGGRLAVAGARVLGHEYAVQASRGAVVELRELTSVRAEGAAIALVEARSDLAGLVLIEPGTLGGLQLLGGSVAARNIRVHAARGPAVLARLAEGELLGLTVTGGGGGDGASAVEVRGGRIALRGVGVRGSSGACVLASAATSLLIEDAELERCELGGLLVDRGAEVRAQSLWIAGSRGPAVVIPEAATLALDALASRGNADGPLWAECAQGIHLTVGRVDSDAPWTLAACHGRTP